MNRKILSFLEENFKGDRFIWVIILCLFSVSMLSVYSATESLAYKMNVGNETYLIKQIVISILGIFLIYFTHIINYKYYSRISQVLWYISIPLLIYTMVFGRHINGASRVIELPLIGLTFQPSDLAKIALIMFLSRQLAVNQDKMKEFKDVMLSMILPVAITCLLIARDNLSTALILYFTSVLVMFIGRVSIKNLSILAGLTLIAAVIFLTLLYTVPEPVLRKYSERSVVWKHRIDSYISGVKSDGVDPDEDYQVQQAKIAIAKGGFFRMNPGGSDQRNYLPEAYNDFIYVIIIEEYGLLGGAFILLLYIFFLYRCITMVVNAPKTFGALLAVGLGIALVTQAIINMAVAVDLLPVTGVTLPLVSMGGSSVIFTSVAIGVILSVSRNIHEEQKLSGITQK